MEKYELTLVLDGKITAAKIKTVSGKLSKLVELFKGKIVKLEEWGKKDLAYPINKSSTGYFLYGELELTTNTVKGLTDKLRIDEDILRYLIIRV